MFETFHLPLNQDWADEIAQWGEALAATPDDLSSVSLAYRSVQKTNSSRLTSDLHTGSRTFMCASVFIGMHVQTCTK